MNKVSVVGGSGFIGTSFCKILCAKGIEFEIIDLEISKHFPNQTKLCDIRNIVDLKKSISGSIIVNLAAVHTDDVTNKSLYYDTNVDGMKNICLVATELGINRILFTSSVAVYGNETPNADELAVTAPINDYGKSKLQAEVVLREWYLNYQGARSIFIVRPTVVFGVGSKGNVSNLIRQIISRRFIMIGQGTNRKSMAYVENIASFLMFNLSRKGSVYISNYVDKPDMSMNELVTFIRLHALNINNIGPRIPLAMGKILGYCADLFVKITKVKIPFSSVRIKKFASNSTFECSLHNFEGFTPPYSLTEGLRQTLNADPYA